MTIEDIQTKIDIVSGNLDKLAQIPQSSLEEFVGDFRNVDSALHRLQTSIQALIDIAAYAVARLGLGTPSTSLDSIDRLTEHGYLPAGASVRFAPIFGFRNRIVHLYDRIDAEIVYRILTEERGDLEELQRLLLAALDRD